MADQLFADKTMDLLKRGLDAYTLRQRVIAENIANSETPGFKARQVSFEVLLQRASTVESRIRHEREGHFNQAKVEGIRPLVSEESDRAMDNGINNVSVDMEMAALAETNLNHKLATRALALRYQLLKKAISGRS